MMIEARDVAVLIALKRFGLAVLSGLILVGAAGVGSLVSGGESEGSDPTRGVVTAQSR